MLTSKKSNYKSEPNIKKDGNKYIFTDSDGKTEKYTEKDKEKASSVIKEYADTIIAIADKHNVNPIVLAGCIYSEQCLNVDWVDSVTDVLFRFMDTSIGVAQVKVSTAKMLEDKGYIPET